MSVPELNTANEHFNRAVQAMEAKDYDKAVSRKGAKRTQSTQRIEWLCHLCAFCLRFAPLRETSTIEFIQGTKHT